MLVRSKLGFIAPVVAVLLATTLAACSSGPSSSGGGSTNRGSGASGSTDVCTLVSASAAGSAVGETFTGAKSGTLSTGENSCTYGTSGNPAALMATVYESSSGMSWTTMSGVLESLGTVKTVAGLGDKAQLGGSQLNVQAGGHIIAIEGDSVATNPSGAEALAKKLISALG
jgi:hypothetical protein